MNYSILGLLLFGTASSPPVQTLFPPKDFVEYWSAARAHLQGEDPYDGTTLLPFQREATGDPGLNEVVSLWTPPWTLPLYWLFGALPVYEAHLAWLILQCLMLIIGCRWLWTCFTQLELDYRSRSILLWTISALIVASFAPTWWMIAFGQNTGYLLLGVAGFLYFRNKDQPYLAGAFAALTAIKPHLLALFGLALLLDGINPKGRKVLIAGISSLVVLAILSMIPNRNVFQQFIEALNRPRTAEVVPLSHWRIPTLGNSIRNVFFANDLVSDPSAGFWIQFLPLLFAIIGVVLFWLLKRKRHWHWETDLPWLVGFSALAAPYGAWIFDLTILLVPVLFAAVSLRWNRPLFSAALIIGLHLLLSLSTLLIPTYFETLFNKSFMLHHFVWFAPLQLVLILVAVTRMQK